ncbi:hypothetical protein BSU04_46470 [Caballeronia sordidicola]|uniref:Uncharacterized protein n=1 Tax=Caballeronia sordidicola TaxID=196367 RepID=A0A226WJT2_CABSO|nr:hypothetical protein BSU04_46470 [Caballeronia sordidicola]
MLKKWRRTVFHGRRRGRDRLVRCCGFAWGRGPAQRCSPRSGLNRAA